MYFDNEEEVNAAIAVIKQDRVFQKFRNGDMLEDDPMNLPIIQPIILPAAMDKRMKLLARRKSLVDIGISSLDW